MLRRFFLILLVVLCLSLLAGSVFAVSDEITNMDGQITVDSNGVCRVVILAEVRFVSRPTTFVFPLATDAGEITASGAEYDKETIDGVECVVFENESGFSGSYTFQCTYTLPCTMTETGSGQHFSADMPERGWEYPINRFKLSITFPTEVTAFPRWTSAYYGDVIDNYLSIQVTGNTVTARSNITFRDHETLNMELDFQPESFDLKHLSEKSVPFDQIAFLLLYGVCVAYWLISLRKNHVKTVKDPNHTFQASAGELPCQLFRDQPDMGALIAHWGNLGYILLRRNKSGRFLIEKQMDMGNERSAAERRIFQAIFRSGSSVEVPGYRFLTACNAEGPVLKAHWKNRLFEKQDGKPGVFLILCLAAGFFFSLMIFDTLLGANPGRWVWIVLLTLLTLPLHRLLQKVVPCFYRPTKWVYLALGAAAALILYVFAASAQRGGYFFFHLLLQVGAGYVTRFGGRRTVAGQEAVEEALSFRRSVAQSNREYAKQILHRDSQYFYRMLPYAEILGVGNRFRKHFASVTTESCPWFVDERNTVRSAREFYDLYLKFLKKIRKESRSGLLRNLSVGLPSIGAGSSGSSGATPRKGSRPGRRSYPPTRETHPRRSVSDRKATTPRRTQHRANPARTGRRS